MKRTKLTDKLKETIIELRAKGCSISEIAEKIGVEERTLYRWLANDSQLRMQVDEADASRIEKLKDIAIDVLKQALTQRQIVEYEIHKNADGQIRKVIEYIRVIPPDVSTAFKIVEKLDKHFNQVENSFATIQVNLFPMSMPKKESGNVTNE